ncbi:hypothetical protein C5167_000942 [Papaver somniferum]|uniref:Cyclin-D1-binding protein 1-like N-terminal domain-containing protein n=1 Tax=Papaver somniferum TaxID=3469 RepID=A0A4Y7KVC9_PAPSO|nr:hypothetical protein C5167_000942 [Papaver somniferum]
MGKSEKENLTTILHKQLEEMQEAFQVLESKPRSSLEKVDWEKVINIAEQLSKKKKTVAGLRWIVEAPDCEELEENMKIHFSMLREFLLLAHRRILDEDRKLSIQQLADSVWEACAFLKKIPTTNHAAIAREITWLAKSMEGALRQLKRDLKPAPFEDLANDNTTDELTTDLNEKNDDDYVDNGSFEGGEIGNGLSPDEMKMAESAVNFFSDTLIVINELVCVITGLGRHSKPANTDVKSVRLLELLLVRCRSIKLDVHETSDEVSKLEADVRQFEDASCDSFFQACECSLRNMKTELYSLEPVPLESELQNMSVSIWHADEYSTI